MHDVIVIGGGPAGLTAGLYSARNGLATMLLEGGPPGGQAALTETIENYPGFPGGIGGPELMSLFARQALDFGLKMRAEMVAEVDLQGEEKTVTTAGNTYQCRALIIASGAKSRPLGVPGEKEFTGRGVSYCATCDGAFFRNKKVAVVGGGDAAVEEALFLTKFARQVAIIHRRDELRATRVLQERARANDKIKFIWKAVVEAIEGDRAVEKVALRRVDTGERFTEPVDGIFVFVGTEPNTGFLQGKLPLTPEGYVETSAQMATSIPGVFAAGDVRAKELRQVATAVGDGAQAAMSAEKYLAALG
ncbi:MAG: thioredoxin-disulfide reductase [Clostridia bacterium]|nr:MAG: thioredoxin-disulfide reductase [Clostridia bacterium]